MLRAHEPLTWNCFRDGGEIPNGAVEGLNNRIRVVAGRSCRFRTTDAAKTACITTWGDSRKQNQRTNSAEETEMTIAEGILPSLLAAWITIL